MVSAAGLRRVVGASVIVVATGVTGCTEETAAPSTTSTVPAPASDSGSSTSTSSTTTTAAGPVDKGELCALFQEVKDFDDLLQNQVAEVLTPLFSLDPATDDVDAEVERLMGELQAIVASVDRDRISEVYTRLAELVPEDLQEDAIALREGTLALIDIFLELEPEELDDIDSQLATPEIIAAGAATLALDELSQDECGIAIAN